VEEEKSRKGREKAEAGEEFGPLDISPTGLSFLDPRRLRKIAC
jgi:hypothetical protein